MAANYEDVVSVINDAICMYEMGQLTREELPREMLSTVLTALCDDANNYVVSFIQGKD